MVADQYFASLEDDRLLHELNQRVDSYYNWMLTSGRLARWRVAYDTYYGQRGSHNSSWLTAGGSQGELTFLMSNEYRNLVQHLLVLATQQRPAIECVAVNTDFKSMTQAILGTGIVEHYFREKKVERVLKHALEISLVMDIAWVFPMWDMMEGDVLAIDPDTGQEIREGDIRTIARTPIDVVTDYTLIDGNRDDWVIVHDYVNKHDMAAQYPEKADELKALQRDYAKDAIFRFGDIPPLDSFTTDAVDRYTFMHRKTPSMPEGRLVTWCSTEIKLFDGPMAFREMPAVRVCPNEQILSVFGYTNANDLLSLQDVMDACISAATTNMTSFGVNNIWVKPKSNFDFKQIAEGMNLIEAEEKPEPIILNKMSGDMWKFMDFIIQRMQTISGVNSVARGDSEGGKLSGAALALLQSMSIQFNSGLQAAYGQMIEDVGTQIITQLQDFSQSDRVALIAGKSRKYMMQSWNSGSIDKISRVHVNQTNPLRNTVSGRLTIAQELLQAGLIKNADEYITVLETGALDAVLDDTLTEQMTIKSENEALTEGGPVMAVWTDHHPTHIQGHKMAIADPQARLDPALVQRVTQHIQEHLNLAMTSDPQALMILGVQPIAPPAAGPQSPMGPNGMTAPSGAGAEVSQLADSEANVKGPKQPKNALSGERFDPETGGMPPDGAMGLLKGI